MKIFEFRRGPPLSHLALLQAVQGLVDTVNMSDGLTLFSDFPG